MPHLQLIERSATVGFCPTGRYIATGTVAGAVDMSFSTNSVLEVRLLECGKTHRSRTYIIATPIHQSCRAQRAGGRSLIPGYASLDCAGVPVGFQHAQCPFNAVCNSGRARAFLSPVLGR